MTPPDVSSGADDGPDQELAELVREFAADPPPPPSEAAWRRVQGVIAARLSATAPRPPRRSHRLKWAGAIGGLAAAVTAGFLAWPPADPTPPTTAEAGFDPLAEYEVLPVATPGDVFVSAVRRDPDLVLVACDHPLPGRMRLATAADLRVQPTPAGELSVPAEGDPVMFVVVEPLDRD
jgi:hypothetical protein